MNRFSQKDILRGAVTEPASLNRYLYVQNDPMNFVDANGMARTGSIFSSIKSGISNFVSAVKNIFTPAKATPQTVTPAKTTTTTAQTKSAPNQPTPSKNTTTVNTTTTVITSSPSTAPAVYTSPAQEYNQYLKNARTPSVSEYQQLQRAGANISYGQYLQQKTTSQVQSYDQFAYDKSIGRPNFQTYGDITVVQKQQSTYYSNSGNYVAANTPSVEYIKTADLYYCEGGKAVKYANIRPLGAGDTFEDKDEYLSRSLDAFFKGKYSDEDPTALTITANIAAGLAGIDAPLDIEALIYDLDHWGESKRFALDLAIDAVALIPVIGALKYLKQLNPAIDGTKALLQISDAAIAASRTAGTAADVAKAADGAKIYGIDMDNLNFSKTVQSHAGRPYQESKLTINEIIESTPPSPDPRGTGALSWDVEGTFNGTTGHYELIIDPKTNTVWHFVFKSK